MAYKKKQTRKHSNAKEKQKTKQKPNKTKQTQAQTNKQTRRNTTQHHPPSNSSKATQKNNKTAEEEEREKIEKQEKKDRTQESQREAYNIKGVEKPLHDHKIKQGSIAPEVMVDAQTIESVLSLTILNDEFVQLILDEMNKNRNYVYTTGLQKKNEEQENKTKKVRKQSGIKEKVRSLLLIE